MYLLFDLAAIMTPSHISLSVVFWGLPPPHPPKKKKNLEGAALLQLMFDYQWKIKQNSNLFCRFHLPSFSKWIRFLRMTFAFSYFDGPATAISASCSIICLFLYSCSSNAALYASTVWAASSRRRNWASYYQKSSQNRIENH